MPKIVQTSERFNKSGHRIRINVDDLLKILQDLRDNGIESFSGSNLNFQFASLDDIESNKELFCGFPRLSIGSCDVEIDEGSFKVAASYLESEDQNFLCEKVYQNLSQYQESWWPLKWLSNSFLVVVGLLILVSIISIIGNGWSETLFWLDSFPLLKWVYFTLFISAVAVHFLEKRQSVFFSPKEGFWRRNLDSVVVGVIMLMIGAVIGKLV